MNHKGIGIFYADKRSDGALQGKWRLYNIRASDTDHFIIATRQDGVVVKVHEHDLRVQTVPDDGRLTLAPYKEPNDEPQRQSSGGPVPPTSAPVGKAVS